MKRSDLAFNQRRPCTASRALHVAAAVAALTVLAACGSLFAPAPPAPHFYTLDAPTPIAAPALGTATASLVISAPVMVVAQPRAEAGFDTDRIVYVLDEHRLQPYADNQWIDTPSKMLGPLISGALLRTGVFGAVLQASSAVNSQWELQSDIVHLQHEVVAARFRFTLHVTLIEKQTRTVVLAREFDATAPITGTNPAAAVAAANVVVADVLRQMAADCASEAARRR